MNSVDGPLSQSNSPTNWLDSSATLNHCSDCPGWVTVGAPDRNDAQALNELPPEPIRTRDFARIKRSLTALSDFTNSTFFIASKSLKLSGVPSDTTNALAGHPK